MPALKILPSLMLFCFLAAAASPVLADKLTQVNSQPGASRQIASLDRISKHKTASQWQTLIPGWQWQVDNSSSRLNLRLQLPSGVIDGCSLLAAISQQFTPLVEKYYRQAALSWQKFSRQLNSLPLVTPVGGNQPYASDKPSALM